MMNMNVNQWFINFLVVVLKMRICQTGNQQKNCSNKLLENPRKEKYIHFFIENILGADLADMQLISKYAQVSPSKDKKCIIITDAFQKDLKESNQKPNKVWTDKGSEFQNRSVKSWL